MSEKTRFPHTREFKLPKMGESITEGTIINWLIREGESFEEGDILLEVGTDKVDNEVPAPFSGKLLEIKYRPKDVVKIGEVIAMLEAVEGQVGKQELITENTDPRNPKPEAKKPPSSHHPPPPSLV